MATINEVVERVRRSKPNVIEEKDQARWLLELDGRVYEEVTKADEPNKLPVKVWPVDGGKPLLVESPYDGIYDLYLTAMICFALGEYGDYNNVLDQFNRTFNEFRAWWRRNHVPKQTARIQGV